MATLAALKSSVTASALARGRAHKSHAATPQTSRAAVPLPSRARGRAAVCPQAFYGQPFLVARSSCRPRTYRRSPLVAGLSLLGPMLASEWLQSASSVHPVDIKTYEDRYELQSDCPGMAEEDVTVEVSPNNVLTIAGSRRAAPAPASRKADSPTTDFAEPPQPGAEAPAADAAGAAAAASPARAVSYRFSRSFALPEDADAGAITAALRRGVLTVAVPRRGVERPRPRRVRVAGDGGEGRPAAAQQA